MSSQPDNHVNNDAVDPPPIGEWVSPLAGTSTNVPKRRKCSFCSNTGHNKRGCILYKQSREFRTNRWTSQCSST